MPFDGSHFESVRKEVARHIEDTNVSKLAHWAAAAVYDRRHRLFIGLPATILSLLLTWMLSANVKTSVTHAGLSVAVVNGAPVIIGLVVSVLSGLGAFLNFNDLAVKHRTAAENLHALWRDCKNWDTDFPDVSLCEKAVQTVQSYRKRLNDINRDAPQIPRWAWKSVRKQLREGSTTYAVESCA